MSRKLSFLPTFFFFSLLFSLSLSNPEETTALLEFKATSDPSNALSSWVTSSDLCSGSWLGVSCHPKTHRVTRLILESLNLTGSTQPLTQLSHVKVLSLNHNHFSSFPNFSALHNLNHLYLSHNRFSGPIPAGITSLRHLLRLDLSHNNFSGEIPMTEFTQLPLLTLRLESNSFTGTLSSPNTYSGSISDFDVSQNNLSGEIPSWMSGFGAVSFAGNDHLCGKPLPYECSNRTAHNPFGDSGRKHGGSGEAVVVTISSVGIAAVLFAMAVVVTRFWTCTKRSSSEGGAPNVYGYVKKHYGPGELKTSKKKSGAWSNEHGLHRPHGLGGGPRESEDMVVLEGGCKGVGKVSDLLKASAEMLGKGSVGTTYKVAMDGGDVVVVKRVREKRIGGKEVDGLLQRVGGLRHENIVSLKAYNNSSYELLLVYDLMPNGSLNFVLHGNRGPGRTQLDWATRFKLALGSAQGLAFLHGCDKVKAEKLFHGHITSSNILIDHMGNACIADTGLQKLCPAHFSSHSGYKAPELLLPNRNSSTKFHQKCDVYSFGVVLLEILTGRVVDDEEGEMGLVEWVFGKHRECTWEVLDFELLGDKETKEEMWALWEVALLCVAPLPKDRPTMGMVHRMIQDIGKNGVGEDGTKSILDDLTTSDSSSPSNSGSTP